MHVRFLDRRTVLLAVVVLAGFLLKCSASLAAGWDCNCRDKLCRCVRRTTSNGWKVLESKSFRVHYVGSSTVAERIAALCEQSRQALRERWLGTTTTSEWTPKCDVFLYPNGAEFQRLTRWPAEMWGVADLQVGDGKVWLRHLYVRTDDEKRLDKVIVHELTHVVLADHFTEHQIPRWADEGIAVLSEPAERLIEMRQWLKQEATQGRIFTLQQLVNQRELPGDRRLGDLFYAQSSSLVEFLLADRRLSATQVLRFVADIEARGLNQALASWFPDVSSATMDSKWRQWMTTARADFPSPDDESRSGGDIARSGLSAD